MATLGYLREEQPTRAYVAELAPCPRAPTEFWFGLVWFGLVLVGAYGLLVASRGQGLD